MTLEKAVEKAQLGDTRAFKAIFDSLNERLFAYALSRTKNRDDALDMVQETFVELWNALPAFAYLGEEAFHSFTFTILKRRIYRLRRAGGKETVPLEEAESVADEPILQEDYRHMYRQMDDLAPHYRKLLTLRYWHDLTFKEIARILRIKEGTAKVRHHRAVQALKANLGGKYENNKS